MGLYTQGTLTNIHTYGTWHLHITLAPPFLILHLKPTSVGMGSSSAEQSPTMPDSLGSVPSTTKEKVKTRGGVVGSWLDQDACLPVGPN